MSKDPKDLKIEEMQQEIDRLTTRRCPYNNWAQVNLKDDVMASTRQLLRKSPVACSLLLFILEKMDRQNALICSMAVFCEALGYSRQTISKGIKILKDANYISVKKYGGTYIYYLTRKSHGNLGVQAMNMQNFIATFYCQKLTSRIKHKKHIQNTMLSLMFTTQMIQMTMIQIMTMKTMIQTNNSVTHCC